MAAALQQDVDASFREFSETEIPPSQGYMLRHKVRQLLKDALKDTSYSEESIEQAEHTAYHCLYWSRPKQYRQRTRRLVYNLKRNAQAILAYEPDLWYGLTHLEMAKGSPLEGERKRILDQPQKIAAIFKKFEEHLIGPTSRDTTMIGKCRSCGSFNTSYTEVQTRRADEGMTVFKYCRDCEKRWK